MLRYTLGPVLNEVLTKEVSHCTVLSLCTVVSPCTVLSPCTVVLSSLIFSDPPSEIGSHNGFLSLAETGLFLESQPALPSA